MATRLNRAAEHRAAANWIGAMGPLACSGLVAVIVMLRAFALPLPLGGLIGDQTMTSALVRMLFGLQVPLVWLFVETTAWRRQAPLRRGRRVLAAQALALGVALAAVHFAGV